MEEIILVGIGLTLLFLVIVFFKINGVGSQISSLTSNQAHLQSQIDTMTAPAETLTQITTALQGQVGIMHQSITNISTQAQKMIEIGSKYENTEKLTRRMHNIMIGSYEKGRTGENYLRNMMNELMKIGIVKQNARIGGKVVEYAVIFQDGKLLAIDSKVVATRDVEILFDEESTEAERKQAQTKIRNGLKRKIDDLCKYIDPQITLPCAIMAVPDSIVNLSSDVVPEAVQKSVMIVGYSAVPQLVFYFVKIHGFYYIEEDIEAMKERMYAIQQELTILDEKFFSNRFDKPLTTITNAVHRTQSVIKGVNTIMRIEQRKEDIPVISLDDST